MKDTITPISSGCFTAIVAPDGTLLGELLHSGEGVVIAVLDFTMIDKRKLLLDSRGHYSRSEVLSLCIDRTPTACLQERTLRYSLQSGRGQKTPLEVMKKQGVRPWAKTGDPGLEGHLFRPGRSARNAAPAPGGVNS